MIFYGIITVYYNANKFSWVNMKPSETPEHHVLPVRTGLDQIVMAAIRIRLHKIGPIFLANMFSGSQRGLKKL